MQLISLTLLAFALILFCCAVAFAIWWHNLRRKSGIAQMLREHIEHIGISAVIEYPDTPAPIFALLEEEYPHSEAIIITDLQHKLSPFGVLIRQYRLVAVNHAHLAGVRALYRSRHRAFRRVVLVDLPIEYRQYGAEVASEVASYDYVMHLHNRSIVARNAIAYCANIIASHHATEDISLRSVLGADVRLERCDIGESPNRCEVVADRVLAWRSGRAFLPLLLPFITIGCVVLAHTTGSVILLVVAAVLTVAIVPILYISCRVVTEKSLFVTLDTILRNFYRFLVERLRNFHYLYKRG